MSKLRTRLQRLELDNHPSMPALTRRNLAELQKRAVDHTRESLRLKLNREPTEAEVAQQPDKVKALFASLSLEELVEIKKKFARQA